MILHNIPLRPDAEGFAEVPVGNAVAVYDAGVKLDRSMKLADGKPGEWDRLVGAVVLYGPPAGVVTADIEIALPEPHIFKEAELASSVPVERRSWLRRKGLL